MYLHKSIGLSECDLKFAEASGQFSGYGAVFGNVDSKNDIIMPGAFADVLKSGDPVRVYVNHGWLRDELPIGTWPDLKEDAKGLLGSAELVMQMPSAANAYWGMKSGLVTGLSIAFIPDKKTTERRSDGVRVIHRVSALKEISVVDDPANAAAQILAVKSAQIESEIKSLQTIREFELFLRDAGGFDRTASKAIIAQVKNLFEARDASGDQDQGVDETQREIAERIARLAQKFPS